MASRERYDLAIIDLMIPGIDGTRPHRGIAPPSLTVPVIILSASGRWTTACEACSVGDDYLTKPFAFEELWRAFQALLSGARGAVEPHAAGGGRPRARPRVAQGGAAGTGAGPCGRANYALLEYLMRNPERVVSKAMILSHVFDYSFDPRTNVVDRGSFTACARRSTMGFRPR